MESDRMMHSLSTQVSYYNVLIQSNPEWEFAGVYADNFISGTSTEKRTEFQRMLADCEAGKIDIVLTKSISRFARNTVDLLETVRHLKELGIEIQFEKEHINSLSDDGELMLSLLASFAQEESRNISENARWAIQKRFEKGIPNGHFRVYGYRWEGDDLVPVPEEAAIVKRIYQNFLDGKSRLETERELAAEGITTRDGCRWVDSNIKSVLSNITYTGNLLLQKEFIEDPVTKKRRKNKGQLPQYFVENTHEPIIDMETFQYVQDEMARRRELGALANKSLNITCFTGKIKCGNCGKSFMHNIRKNRAQFTTTYTDEDGMYTTWVCGSRKQKQKGEPCMAKEIPDKILKACCAEVLGLDEFDDEVFAERVERIDVPDGGILVFHFYDGTEVTKEWKSTAKQDCWTDEYKDRQREWVRNYMAKGDGRFSPFTTRIKCGCCGGSCRRQVQGSSDGKIAYWRCSGGGATNCGIKGIREPELMEIAAGLMGLPEFDGDAFREQVDHITMVKSGLLEFTFTDGHTEEAEYSTKRKGKPWTEEQRAKFKESIKGSYTPERRKAMSEHMKQVRRERYWNSKGKSKQSHQP
jgi:DNA invertase Pin-like site-specific DNA recombinase